MTGFACGQDLSCSGDAHQCAILAHVKAQRCLSETALDLPKQKTLVENFVNGQDFPLNESEVDVSSLFDTGTRFLPSNCPPPESFHLTSNGGRTFQVEFEPLCKVASDFSYIIVAVATMFFLIYVGRGAGSE